MHLRIQQLLTGIMAVAVVYILLVLILVVGPAQAGGPWYVAPGGDVDQPLSTDQRGLLRFGPCEIGAHELQSLGSSTKTVSPPVVRPGEPLTYTLWLTNGGNTALSGVRLTDTFPLSLTYKIGSLSATSGSYGYSSGVITWTGSIDAAEAVTITFEGAATPILGPIANSALISGGGELLTRTALLEVRPYYGYLPCVIHNLCPLLYADDFSDPGSGWPVDDDGNIRLEYLYGEYRILVREPDWWAGARPGYKASDYVIAMDLRNASGADGSYGFMFGLADDWSQFYSFEIYPDRYYAIWQYGAGSGWTLLTAGASPHINAGTASNHIKLQRQGTSISAHANGHLLASITDSSYLGVRHVGLTASGYDQPNLDVRFDSFTVHPAGCGLTADYQSLTGSTLQGETRATNQSGAWQERHSRSLR